MIATWISVDQLGMIIPVDQNPVDQVDQKGPAQRAHQNQ